MKSLANIVLLCLVGCASTGDPERGRDGTIAYYIEIESEPPGQRIEVDHDYIGRTPIRYKIFGDPDGTFHNWGQYEVLIEALPDSTNLFPQSKLFRTGGWWSPEDKIPSRIYFNMTQRTSREVIINR